MWTTLLLYCTYDRLPQYFNNALVNYQFAEANFSGSEAVYFPPIEKKKKRKNNAKTQFKKKFKNIKNRTQKEGINPLLGGILAVVGGLILAALAIYLGTLLIPWSAGLNMGCYSAFLPVILGSLAWFGWVLLCIIVLALIIIGFMVIVGHTYLY